MICTGPFLSRGASHRTSEFEEKLALVRQKILAHIGLGWKLAVIPCSGTGAVEAMLRGLRGNYIMSLTNGSYGWRMIDIARTIRWITYSLSYDIINDESHNWLGMMIGMVHGETSTGQLNDIDAVLDYAKKHGKYVAVDAVASFMFDEIPFANERLGAVAFSSNKGLRGMPGVGFVAYRPELVRDDYDSCYLNLDKWSTDKTPFTPATEIITDLANKLKEPHYILEHMNRYKRQAFTLAYDLNYLGLDSILSSGVKKMNCLQVIKLESQKDKISLIDYMKEHDIELYNGDGDTVRISIMNLFDDNYDGWSRNYSKFMSILKAWSDKHDKQYTSR